MASHPGCGHDAGSYFCFCPRVASVHIIDKYAPSSLSESPISCEKAKCQGQLLTKVPINIMIHTMSPRRFTQHKIIYRASQRAHPQCRPNVLKSVCMGGRSSPKRNPFSLLVLDHSRLYSIPSVAAMTSNAGFNNKTAASTVGRAFSEFVKGKTSKWIVGNVKLAPGNNAYIIQVLTTGVSPTSIGADTAYALASGKPAMIFLSHAQRRISRLWRTHSKHAILQCQLCRLSWTCPHKNPSAQLPTQ
jgi:hypothetical protein